MYLNAQTFELTLNKLWFQQDFWLATSCWPRQRYITGTEEAKGETTRPDAHRFFLSFCLLPGAQVECGSFRSCLLCHIQTGLVAGGWMGQHGSRKVSLLLSHKGVKVT